MTTRTRTVTVDLAAQARHKRAHYQRRIAAGDRIVQVWMTPETQESLRVLMNAMEKTQGSATIEAVVAHALNA